MNTPTSTSPHGRFWLSRPRMIVDISVACGAGSELGSDRHHVVQVERGDADDERGGHDPDDEADLLVDGRRADDEAGLEILRGRAGNRRGDADHRADAERDRRVVVADPADADEDRAGQDQRGDRHARDRVRRVADEARDAGRDRHEEEAEQHHEDGGQDVALRGRPGSDDEEDGQQDASRRSRRSAACRARCARRPRHRPRRRSPSRSRGTT